jgi:hypothetical protein
MLIASRQSPPPPPLPESVDRVDIIVGAACEFRLYEDGALPAKVDQVGKDSKSSIPVTQSRQSYSGVS